MLGLAYEKKILSALKAFFGSQAEILAKPWIEFQDKHGWGVCQPDALIFPQDENLLCILVEVKLTHKPEAESKLRNFYGPIMRRAFKRKWKYIQVVKNIESETSLRDFEQIVADDYEYDVCLFRC